MKLMLRLTLVAAAAAAFSCSPTPTEPAPNSLIVAKSSVGILSPKDTANYSLYLACGCPFPMKVEAADTTNIRYEFPDLGDTISIHGVRAMIASAGLPSGTYYGSLAVVTAPPTVEVFRDTLRDTLVVP